MVTFCCLLCLGLVTCIGLSASRAMAQENPVRMISTIGPFSSGVLDALAQAFEKETGIKVTLEGAGTGAALEKARKGGFDIVLVHARKLEDLFVAEGYGLDRRDVMFNDYVILGPKNDPAGIRGLTDAAVALKKIGGGAFPFVTRGDRSGTHMSEMELWDFAGFDMSKNLPEWYTVCPVGDKGNGPTAKFASEHAMYILVERATWLAIQKESALDLLMSGDPRMKNFMAVIRINPEKFEGTNAAGALRLTDWLVDDAAQKLINSFGVDKYGEPMFFPNSDKWNAKNT